MSHLKARLRSWGTAGQPDKYLGQNFLIDETVLAEITALARQIIQPADRICEIGPGLGSLTERLLGLGVEVIALEKDPVMAQKLIEWLDHPAELILFQGDALRLLADNHSPLGDRLRDGPWCVVSNVPFAITSPLLRLLVRLPHPPHHSLLLVQKEAAARVCARPGDAARGWLTVELEMVSRCRIVGPVPSEAFWPSPKVTGSLLQVEALARPVVPPGQQAAMRRVARAGFGHKRKKLVNSLAISLNRPTEAMRQALIESAINPDVRAEQLTVKEWQALTEALRHADEDQR